MIYHYGVISEKNEKGHWLSEIILCLDITDLFPHVTYITSVVVNDLCIPCSEPHIFSLPIPIRVPVWHAFSVRTTVFSKRSPVVLNIISQIVFLISDVITKFRVRVEQVGAIRRVTGNSSTVRNARYIIRVRPRLGLVKRVHIPPCVVPQVPRYIPRGTRKDVVRHHIAKRHTVISAGSVSQIMLQDCLCISLPLP